MSAAGLLATATAMFSIEGGSAAYRLKDFSTQSRLQVLFGFTVMEPIYTNPVSGQHDLFTALDLMLAGTGIEYEYVNNRTVTLTAPPIEYAYASEGWAYTCEPLAWVAGYALTRVGRLLFDMGVIDPETKRCTAYEFIGDEAETVLQAFPSYDIVVQGHRAPDWGPRR